MLALAAAGCGSGGHRVKAVGSGGAPTTPTSTGGASSTTLAEAGSTVAGGSGTVVTAGAGSGTANGATTPTTPTAHTSPAPTAAPATTTPPPPGSGVQGVVTAGPTCPVQRPGDPSCNDRPVPADLTITPRGSASPAVNAHAGTDGTFRAALAPGDYTIQATSPDAMRCAPLDFTVPGGRYADVRVSCDTGIR